METQTKAPRAIQERMARKATRATRASRESRESRETLHPSLHRHYLHIVSRRLSSLLREVLEALKVLQAVLAGLLSR